MQAFYFDTVDSTNDEAGRLLRDGRIGPCAYVVARGQSAGKGNRGRKWSSPMDAGIYLSVVDRPARVECELQDFTRAAGVACVETLWELTRIEVRLKPINDLFVNGRKLGGILTEAVIEQGCIRALITGVGINVRRADRALPSEHLQPTCLEELMAADSFAGLNLPELTVALVRRIREWNVRVSKDDGQLLEIAWRKHSLAIDAPATGVNPPGDAKRDVNP